MGGFYPASLALSRPVLSYCGGTGSHVQFADCVFFKQVFEFYSRHLAGKEITHGDLNSH
jgi:hypothetical protein